MRILSRWTTPILTAGLLALTTALSAPVFAASPDVPAAIASKVAEGSDLSRLFAEPGVRLPVIVQFAAPALADAASYASPAAADAAQTSAVHAAQDAILAAVFGPDAVADAGSSARHVKRMSFSPMFGIQVTADELAALAANASVLKIHEDALSAPVLDQAVPLIGMPAAYAAGATGSGWAVSILDTGSLRTHEFLTGKVVSAACYNSTVPAQGAVTQCLGGAEESTNIDTANDCDPTTIAGCGHGTHVAGIAAGFNTNRQAGEPANGVARAGNLIPINVFSKFTGASCGAGGGSCVLAYSSDQQLALERVFALRNTFNIASINMSLGGGQNVAACDGNALKPIIDQLRAAGIATAIAAGNDGFDSSVSAPGCISTAITVASSDKQDVRSGFSNWGTLIDLVAPGSLITSSVPNSITSYGVKSGTSMATPVVAGAIAAIRSAKPNATVDQIETALKNTGLGITAAGVTKPRIRVDQALTALGGGGTPAIVSAVTPVARATSVGGTVTAFATILNYGTGTASACSIVLPGGNPVTFNYWSRNVNTGDPEGQNTPIDIAANSGRNFVMSFQPTATMQANMSLTFACANAAAAPSVLGLNTFLLTATTTAPADLVSIAVTATGDGIMNVPLSGTGFAALAAVNIGTGANLQARLSPTAIGGSGGALPATLTMCQTNSSGTCFAAPSPTVDFTAAANETVTFSAFAASNGTPIPFDPANTRMFVHFFQGNTPVGSASVAVRTTSPDAKLAAAN